MTSAQHDELARLFAQNMHLHQQAPAIQQHPPMIEEVLQSSEEKQPITFASAHYTQSAHVRADSEPSRSPPPPYHEAVMPEAMADTLRQHSIDPSALLPNQVSLFRNADYEQRLRLLELWRISPPFYPLEKRIGGQWQQTSIEKEEQEARERYEQQQMNGRAFAQKEHMLDMEPMKQMEAAEPYIVNGYEIAVSRHAVDPVYNSPGLWSTPSYVEVSQQQTSMEDQYGMYEQIRNHADWERMNEQIAREKFMGMHGPVDDDMVM